MKLHYLLPLLSFTGFLLASYTVVSSNQPMPVAQAVAEPSSAPFKSFIAGSGIIEPKSQNIALGTPLSRLIKTVLVKVGQRVSAGSPLLLLDDRDTLAELAIKHADLSKAQADLKLAEASWQDSRSLSKLIEAVADRRAISEEESLRRRNALMIAEAKLESAKALVKQVEASVAGIQNTLERLVIRAPIDAQILQVNVRTGEFAQSGVLATPLMIIGNLTQLHVRVDIDENDAWRFDKRKKAVAYLRGNRQFKVDLNLAYVEPFVVPKKSLTGDSTERVDTRVLQVLYSFEPAQIPLYVGQQMDVFIEADDFGAEPKS